MHLKIQHTDIISAHLLLVRSKQMLKLCNIWIHPASIFLYICPSLFLESSLLTLSIHLCLSLCECLDLSSFCMAEYICSPAIFLYVSLSIYQRLSALFAFQIHMIRLLKKSELLVDKAYAISVAVGGRSAYDTASYADADDTASSENTGLDQRPFTVPNAVAFSLTNGK